MDDRAAVFRGDPMAWVGYLANLRGHAPGIIMRLTHRYPVSWPTEIPPFLSATAAAANVIEHPDSPSRLADAFLAGYRSRGTRTLCYWRNEFHVWNGRQYTQIPANEFEGMVWKVIEKEFLGDYDVDKIAYEASKGESDPPKVRKVTIAIRANTVKTLESRCMLPGLEAAPAWLQELDGGSTELIDPAEVVSAVNGLVHLPSYADHEPDAIGERTPLYFTLNSLGFAVDPSAESPEWLAFLHSVWPDDHEAIALLQEWFGYLLTPDTRQQKMLLMVGPPRSGKGTILRVIRELIGHANTCAPSLGSLGGEFGLSSLLNKTAALMGDVRLGNRADIASVTERLLGITGEDAQDVNRKHLPILHAALKTRFVMAANELPRLRDSSGALASRFCILKLTESHLGKEDADLASRLHAELPGIFNWAVVGWKRLRRNGRFTVPTSMAAERQRLADFTSPIGVFVRECCQLDPNAREPKTAVFEEWKRWCERSGIKEAGTDATFANSLYSFDATIDESRSRTPEGRVNCYTGIRLRTHSDDFAEYQSDSLAACEAEGEL